MRLLNITTQPIKYEIEIERAKLEVDTTKPEVSVSRVAAALNIHTKNIEVRLDSTQMRASMNLLGAGDFASMKAQEGREGASAAVSDAVQIGNQLARIDEGITIGQLMRQRVQQQPTTETRFLPSEGYLISWEPNEIEMSYDPGEVNLDWNIQPNKMSYVPGDFTLNILQYPKVVIEYVGEPSYVPPSANPNYEENLA